MESEVKAKLEALHEQFDAAETGHLTAEAQQQMDELKNSVRLALDQPGSEHHMTLRERLDQAIVDLDESYPVLSSAIRDAITVLTQSGV